MYLRTCWWKLEFGEEPILVVLFSSILANTWCLLCCAIGQKACCGSPPQGAAAAPGAGAAGGKKNAIQGACAWTDSVGLENINIIMKPTNCPIQGQPNPREIRLKLTFGPIFPTANIFSWVRIGFIEGIDYKKYMTQPTNFSANTLMTTVSVWAFSLDASRTSKTSWKVPPILFRWLRLKQHPHL